VKKILEYRYLIKSFAIYDLKSRYRNSVLGFAWTIVEPLLMLTVLFLVFTHLMKFEIENYPLYLLLGIILWNNFSRGTTIGMNSILNRGSILKNVYLPKEVLPISSTLTSFLMLFFEFLIFGIFLIIFNFNPGFTGLYLIPVCGLLFLLGLGISFPLSVFRVRYKDLEYIWAIIIHAGFFVSPIIYRLDMFPEDVQRILLINPVAQILNMSYLLTLEKTIPNTVDILYTVIVILSILGIGYLIFNRKQKNIVELI
jgi:lipopolysaccharide transport system permease protein